MTHPMTRRCAIAVQRAQKALTKAQETHAQAASALLDAEMDLAAAQRDLLINQELDQRPAGYNQGARS